MKSNYKPVMEMTRRAFLKRLNWLLALPLVPYMFIHSGCASEPYRYRNRVRSKRYLLQNGSVFLNGRFEKKDMIVEDGVILDIRAEIPHAAAPDTKIVDCANHYISPGWVDSHCHIGGIGVDLDVLGAEMGVTALVEAGTYGPDTFETFMEQYYHQANIPVYVFLNVRKNGIQYSNALLKSKPGVEDIDGARRLIDENPGIIKGLKVRLDSLNTTDENPTFLADVTAGIGNELQLPVMYHLGNPEPSIIDFLQNTKPGDIITHCFRKNNNSVIDASGNLRPEAVQARSEGVLFDVGHGVGSFEFDIARRALDRNFTEFTISSDLWFLPYWFKSRTFANVASKFLALGLDIADVTRKISSRPRKRLNIESEIACNRPMDVTIFSIVEGEFTYTDTDGNSLPYHQRIVPEYTILNGDLIQAGYRDKDLFLK